MVRLPLVEFTLNCAPDDCVVMGISLDNLPDVVEWWSETAPSFGMVMFTFPEVLSI